MVFQELVELMKLGSRYENEEKTEEKQKEEITKAQCNKRYGDMGWLKKNLTIKVKKKCTEK